MVPSVSAVFQGNRAAVEDVMGGIGHVEVQSVHLLSNLSIQLRMFIGVGRVSEAALTIKDN